MEIIDNVLKDKKLEDLQIPKVVKKNTLELTTEKIESTILLLKEIEQNNGYLGIARKIRLSRAQVEKIHQKMNKKIAELTPKEE